MSIKRSLIKNTGFNLAGYVYLLLASFFSISILLQNLGRDVFGVYILLVSFISLSSVFDFGISSAVVRRLSLPDATREDKIKTWKTSFSIFIAIAFILFVTVSCLLLYLIKSMPIFSHIDSGVLNWSTLILAIIVFVNFINNHFLNLPQAEQRFDIFNSKTLLVGSANTIISALVSSVYPNIAIILGVQLIFHLLTSAYITSYALKIFSGNDFGPHYDTKTGKELFSFGLKNFIGTLAGQLESQFSNFILGAMVSAQAITAFNIPQSIVTKGAGVVSQFAQAFFPLSTSLLSRDRIKKLRQLVLGLQALVLAGGILAVVLTFTVGEAFLTWWLKDPVVIQTSYPVLKVLSFYFLLVSLTPIPTALVQGLNKPQIPSMFAVLTVFVEVTASFYFVPRFGALGVAYAFLLATIISVPGFLATSWILLSREIFNLHSYPETTLDTNHV